MIGILIGWATAVAWIVGVVFVMVRLSRRSSGPLMLVLLVCATSAQAVTNSLTITEKTGATQTNYPIQIGRPFVQGEIADYPQAILDGTPVTTQADVKTRWGDGSVKHAILSFLIPSLAASTTVTVTFQNQATGNNTALTKSAMLDAAYDFNAQMELTNGTTVYADARTMLNADAYTTWLSGPVSTCIILADHSASRAYDIGFDAYESFRPIFHACFWPTINKVRVRFIGEVSNTEVLQDQLYGLTLKTGNAAPVTAYTHDMWMAAPYSPTYDSPTTFTITNTGCYYASNTAARYSSDKLLRFKTTASGEAYVTARVTRCNGDPSPDLVTIDSAVLDAGLTAMEVAFTHAAATRWTKEYWINTAPTAIAINDNLAYLVTTKQVMNWDTTRVIPEATMASYYTFWITGSHDLYDVGFLYPYMPSTGGRPDIGPVPTWTARWIYTGDARMREIAFGNGDLAGAWPMHFREGNATKYLDRANSVPGMGYPLSLSSRRTFWANNLASGNLADRVVPVGTLTLGGWTPDTAHQPEPFGLQYLLSGDYWYLEQMQFWAAYSAARMTPDNCDWWGRGLSGAEGGIDGGSEVRADAWTLRTRAYAAVLTPDADPFKAYLTTLTNDAIARWEGVRDITGTAFENTDMWKWGAGTGQCQQAGGGWYNCSGGCGKKRWLNNTAPTVLRYWHGGSLPFVTDPPINSTLVALASQEWQQHMIIFALGWARDLGFATDALLAWLGPILISEVTDPTYDYRYIASYRYPLATLGPPVAYYTTLAEQLAGYRTPTDPVHPYDIASVWLSNLAQVEHSYAVMASTALSQTTHLPNGMAAWAWAVANIRTPVAGLMNDNPKWAIMPRSTRPYAPLLRRIETAQ